MTMTLGEHLDTIFAYHPPPDASVALRHEEVRIAARQLARTLVELVPPGHELDRAIDAVRQAMYWGNAGIACWPLRPRANLQLEAKEPGTGAAVVGSSDAETKADGEGPPKPRRGP